MVRQTTCRLQALRGGNVRSPVEVEATDATSGSNSDEEEDPSGRHPDAVGDSHDACSHGVGDGPEEVRYVRDGLGDRGRGPASVPNHEACARDRPACDRGRGEAYAPDCSVSCRGHYACGRCCPVLSPCCLCLKSRGGCCLEACCCPCCYAYRLSYRCCCDCSLVESSPSL